MNFAELASAVLTLILVMDPIGNVPVFLGILKDVDEKRRTLDRRPGKRFRALDFAFLPLLRSLADEIAAYRNAGAVSSPAACCCSSSP